MSDEKKPRERVVELMRRMARASALLGGAASLGAVECCSSPMVCDPLPPAITCASPSHEELLYAELLSASWASVDGGPLAIALTVTDTSVQTLAFHPEGLTVTGGTLLSASVTGRQLLASLAPGPGGTTLRVTIPFGCIPNDDSMTVELAPGFAQAGAAVPVSLVSP